MSKIHVDHTTQPQNETKKQRKKQARREAKLMLKIGQARKDVQKAQQSLAKAHKRLEEHNGYLRELEEKLDQLRSSPGSQDDATRSEIRQEQAGTEVMIPMPVAQQDDGAGEPSAMDGIWSSADLAQEQPVGDMEQDLSAINEAATTASPVEKRDDVPQPQQAQTNADVEEAKAEKRDGTPQPQPVEQAQASASTQKQESDQDSASAQSELSIESGGGSMPIVTEDEHAWPPPKVREEVAQGILEEAAHHPASATGAEKGTTAEGNEPRSNDNETAHNDAASSDAVPQPRRTRRRTTQRRTSSQRKSE